MRQMVDALESRLLFSGPFNIGDRVTMLEDGVTVRANPAGTSSGTQSVGRLGTITDGPVAAVLNNTQYTWYKTDWDSGVDGWSADVYVGKASVSPAPGPSISNPGTSSDTGLTLSTLAPTMSWSGVAGATKYGLYISKAPYGSANIVYTNTSITGTAFTLPNGALQDGTKYRWNMTSFNGAGEGSPGNTLYFQTPHPDMTLPGPFISAPGTSSDTGTSVPSLTPTFTWGALSGATSYGLYISKAPYGAANIVYSNTSLTGTSLVLPAGKLASGTKYRWNMTSFNSVGEGSPGNTLYFQTAPSVTLLPGPTGSSPGTSSDTGSTASTLTPVFTWSSSGASSYGLYISKAPYGSGNIVFSKTGITGTSFPLPSGILVNGTKYRWNMTSVNSAGEGPAGNTLYFQTSSLNQVLTGPKIISPGTASDTGVIAQTLTPSMVWNSVTGATRYGIYISKAPYGSANLVYSNTTLTGPSFAVPAGILQTGVKYRWNMTTFNSAGEGSPGNTLYFQTGSIVNKSTLSGKVWNDTASDGLNPNSETGVAGRTVYLDDNNDGKLETWERTVTTDANGAYSFTALVAGTYVVRQVLPSGWIQTSPMNLAGNSVTLASGQAVTGQNFGTVHATAYYTDGFDYPMSDRGYDSSGKPRPINESSSSSFNERNTLYPNNPTAKPFREGIAPKDGWANVQDVGDFNSEIGGLHPGEDWNRYSKGLPADTTQKVFAVANGIVVRIVRASNNEPSSGPPVNIGWTIVILHTLPDGHQLYSIYMHVTSTTSTDGAISWSSEFPYQVGSKVKKGDAIARIGAIKGLSPHLHFEMRWAVRNLRDPSQKIYPGSVLGYYAAGTTPQASMSLPDVTAAFAKMKNEGIIDPSDFIDDHRPLVPLAATLAKMIGSSIDPAPAGAAERKMKGVWDLLSEGASD